MPEDDAPTGQQAFRPLDRPRRPSPGEQRLLSWLAARGGDELTAQVADALVTGVCACGCSSVELATSAAPLTETGLRRLSGAADPGHVAVRSVGRGPDRHAVDVVLHLVAGRVIEVEVFDTEVGEGGAVDPATLTRLSRPEVD